MSQRVNIISSVQFSHSVVSNSLQSHGLQHTCPSPTPRACSNSCPLSQWCHPTISSSVVPFSCLLSFPASGSFPVSQFFTSGGQSIGASASVLPMNIQDWFPLGWTGLFSLQSKGLSRVFSNTTIQKHQFFGAQFSLQSNSIVLLKWEGRDQQPGSQKSQWKWVLIIWRDVQPHPQERCKRKLHQDAISCLSDCQNTKYLTTLFTRKPHQQKCKIL